ncbi:hypothetical protein A3I95_00610 [Candidatus Nomurabacteria bacterium RIFCSPLOWO2_02_FULL_44_12]|uniref:Uncharacterized protein n=1 Tax=Candidatus Nomurabacteria bacterium RIFCSPLOWO2_12_FULL_44_11 TaxID=1801796 RepID=A0A1F6Y806_9BACT|nr:MAG: hypothetical protein A3E95_01725 [Candidatus Nomurabacteria bacterium RIFCSPHIGHO2_12_FULL_44_22b]OGJ02472.1 MAG: hypothetical protein A3G53_01080 [Candidatus Nomurabacteria bacterium RIFCSPLOWO2_12_FULL_44_11]OGJ07307.1 MAG: hypothetical protein A3I95_00610 [Candidatus Nomurabacteria bacterium RIFCSPLOWO2_02_FULL_44_12]
MNFFSPTIAYADFNSFLININAQIVNPIINVLFALAIALFLWGLFEFLANQSNEEKRTEGKSHMLWGVVGLAIMLGVFTIMNIILNTIGVKNIHPETGKVDKFQ